MKKLNNKGLSIIELIVTIALISVIMLFLYALLSNITFESDSEYIDIKDRTTREDIIRTINDTINEHNEISDYKDKVVYAEANDKKLYIKTYDIINIFKIQISSDDKTLIFGRCTDDECESPTIIQKWTLKTGEFGNITCSDNLKNGIEIDPSPDSNNNDNVLQLQQCNIPVYTNNINNKEENNNIMDDISIQYGVTPIPSNTNGAKRILTLIFNDDASTTHTRPIKSNDSLPNTVTIPTIEGEKTFTGYFNYTGAKTTKNIEALDGGDIGKIIQTTITLSDTPTSIKFYDLELKEGLNYTIDNDKKCMINIILTESMIKNAVNRGITVEGATFTSDKIVNVGTVKYYDQDGKRLINLPVGNENIKLFARYE